MIRLIEALNFRCIRFIHQPMKPFHVLIGPNASGKTTFLDVIGFLGSLVSDGLESAVNERTQNFQDLVFGRKGDDFELAVEAVIPQNRQEILADKSFDTIRYEVKIFMDSSSGEIGIQQEKVLLKKYEDLKATPKTLFPMEPDSPQTIMSPEVVQGARTILSKAAGGNDNYYSEVSEDSGKGWFPSIRLGTRKSTFGNLPEDESRFPASTWLKTLLAEGIHKIMLNSLLIRKASPPGQSRYFKPDGSNLPWVIEQLRKTESQFHRWLDHVRIALPDIEDIQTVERADDKHRYLVICYHGGFKIPSWMISDGTLRFLALTIPAYLPDFQGVYLIEEPENGIHPSAVEIMFQSLSSVYDAQILLATHSPVILSLADVSHILIFKKADSGATDIVAGTEHPQLHNWKGETNLGSLFAGGVLG